MRLGTTSFILGTIGLTIPFLSNTLAAHGDQDAVLNPASILSQDSFAHKYGFYTYSFPPLKQTSPYPTLVTHMFHHVNLHHWLSNIIALTHCAYYLDLGLLKSTILFLGGGLTGLFSQIISTAFTYDDIRDHLLEQWNPTLNKISSAWSYFGQKPGPDLSERIKEWIPQQKTITYLCGASAGLYAFVGVETVQMLRSLYNIVFYPRRTIFKSKRDRERAMALILGNMMLRSVSFLLVFTPSSFGSARTMDKSSSVFKVGHIAHFGGFTFGCLFAMYFNI